MGKILKIFLVVVAVAVAFIPGVGHFLSNALFQIIGSIYAPWAAAAFGIVKGLVLIGALAGISLLGGLFRKTPDLTAAMLQRLQATMDPIAPRKIVFGATALATDVLFQEQYGTKQDRLVKVFALASHKIQALDSLWFEDVQTWTPGGGFTGKFASGMISARVVTEGSLANVLALGSGTYWTTSAQFKGGARFELVFSLDPKKWPGGGTPGRLTLIGRGCPVYDPRLDSTAGGSGSHRATDQTTWEYTHGGVDIGRNPALCLLTYLLGYKINGVPVWGMGVPTTLINLANFIAYANLCEETVLKAGGGTVQRYTCDLILSDGDLHETNRRAITACMGSAELVDLGGMYALIGGYDDTATAKVTLTDADFVGPYQWKPAPPLRERINRVRGRFANPDKLFQLEDWGEITTALGPDQIPRYRQLDLPGVSRSETAQRIAKQVLLRDTYPGTLTCQLGPRMFAAQVGSLVSVTLSSEGWNGKLFRVTSMGESIDLVLACELREESSAIYVWDREETALASVVAVPTYDPTITRTPAGLAIASRVVTGSNGLPVQYADITWTPDLSGLIDGIQVETKVSTASLWEQATDGLYDETLGATGITVTAPAGVTLQARARYRMGSGIFGPYASTASAAIPAVSVPGGAISPGTITDPPYRAQSALAINSTATSYTDVAGSKITLTSLATTDRLVCAGSSNLVLLPGYSGQGFLRLVWRAAGGAANSGTVIGDEKGNYAAQGLGTGVQIVSLLTGLSGDIEIWLQVRTLALPTGFLGTIPGGVTLNGFLVEVQRSK